LRESKAQATTGIDKVKVIYCQEVIRWQELQAWIYPRTKEWKSR